MVFFENEHFLAADKPSGWLSVPSRQGAADPRPCLGVELAKAKGRLWPVHRLDEEVSGLVLFARHAEAHRVANAWFEGRQVHKRYEAWTEGQPPPSAVVGTAQVASKVGAVDAWLRWESTLLRGKRRAYESPAGKPSVTLVRWLRTIALGGAQAQVWELEPLTGRGHQLRYELAKHGCPIVGDALYGAKTEFWARAGHVEQVGGVAQAGHAAQAGSGVRAIALRARRLDFTECPNATAYGLPPQIEVQGLTDA